MRVLLLTPIPHQLADAIEATGDRYSVSMEEPKLWPDGIDFVISFGYRYIIPPDVIDYYQGRMINIHISLLPWNRGADPNFWSWFDHTPKGISIHAIDPGIDTGDVLVQKALSLGSDHTLRSSYSTLVAYASYLFTENWPKLRQFDWTPNQNPHGKGSYHQIGDKDKWMAKLPLGWDTPVKDVEELGAARVDN